MKVRIIAVLIAVLAYLALFFVAYIFSLFLIAVGGYWNLLSIATPFALFCFFFALDRLCNADLYGFVLRRLFHYEKPEDGTTPKSDPERIQELEKRVGKLQKKLLYTKILAYAAIALFVYLLWIHPQLV